MNLYLFNATDSAATYGIGTYLNELTNALKDTAINIHIVHLHSVRTEFEIVKTGQLEHWYIPEVRNQNTFSGSVQMLEGYYSNVIYLLRIYIKDTANLIFHFNHNLSLLIAKELKAVFNCKTVVTIHYRKWILAFHGNLLKWRSIQLKSENQRTEFEELLCATDAYEKLLYKEVDSVIALSQHMKYVLETDYQLDHSKISVIPNGLLTIDIVETTNYLSLRRKWHISENESLILFAGRLHPVKGLTFLIRAFRNVLEKIPKCRLMIAGNGHYDTYFQISKDICTKITFTDLLEKQELYELYQIADAGVVPSLYEPFGYVAVEMMMHGLPIVATATSGLNEVVDDTCGLKVPIIEYPDKVEVDTNLLAEKIIYLLQHPNERKRLGSNARNRYLKHYSSEVFRRNMINLYTSL